MAGGDGNSRLYFDFWKTSYTSEEQLSFKPLFCFHKRKVKAIFILSSRQADLFVICLEGKKKQAESNLKWCQTKVIGEVMVAFADTSYRRLEF